jgi:membrane protein
MLRYFRSRILPTKPVQLFVQTGLKWHRDDCGNLAAALAFHALFSLFPLLLVILGITGAILGPNTAAFQAVTTIAARYSPPDVHRLIAETITALHEKSFGAGAIGFGLLFYSSSTVFTVLRQSVSKIWSIPQPEQLPPKLVISRFLLRRLLSMVWVFGVVILLLISIISSLTIRFVTGWVASVPQLNPFPISQPLQILVSFVILSLAVSFLFKSLPVIKLYWRDVAWAGILTAALLVGLQQLVTNSVITIGGNYLSYGVIGNVMILLLWIYFTSQIFLFGCEFSYLYTHLYGSRRRYHL